MMRLSLKILISVGTALLFSGCTGNTPKPLAQQQRVVKNIGNHYYYVPSYAQGGKLDKKWAYINGITSSGLLQCKKNYAWLANPKADQESQKALGSYEAILTASERKELYTHPTSIPRKDTKEYRNMVKVETELVRSGQTYCMPPMSQKKVKEYKAYQAQQAKINNDPRVIAARANQSAARMNYQAATATKNVNYNVNHSGYVNYSGSVYHYGY